MVPLLQSFLSDFWGGRTYLMAMSICVAHVFPVISTGKIKDMLFPRRLLTNREIIIWLVVSTHLKNMLVKLEIFPNFRGENSNKKCLSCHHLVMDICHIGPVYLSSLINPPQKNKTWTSQPVSFQWVFSSKTPLAILLVTFLRWLSDPFQG